MGEIKVATLCNSYEMTYETSKSKQKKTYKLFQDDYVKNCET